MFCLKFCIYDNQSMDLNTKHIFAMVGKSRTTFSNIIKFDSSFVNLKINFLPFEEHFMSIGIRYIL